MLFIDGKRVTAEELDRYLESYNKIVTLTLANAGKGRYSTNAGWVKPQSKVNLPMRYTITDPKGRGRTISVIYSALDDVDIDQNGNVKKEYQPKVYSISQAITLLKSNEQGELIVALAMHPYNSMNYFLDGAVNIGTSAPIFTLPKRGQMSIKSNDKDELMLEALSYVVGADKISDMKAMGIYKVLGLDPIHLENEDIKSIRAELSTFAKSDPARFIAAVKDGLGDMKSKIAVAFEKGILSDSPARKITWGVEVKDRDHKATLCQYPIGADKVSHFADFLVKRDLDGSVRDKLLQELEAGQA